jgi:molecular chaperone DnaK (HSP70)
MLAIDFGTSNTVVACLSSEGEAHTLSLPNLSRQTTDNPSLIPSQVYVEDARTGRVVVGQAVSDRGLDVKGDPRFFCNFKRGIGVDVRGFVPELDGVAVTPELVGTWFLRRVVQAVQQVQTDMTSDWVLTVPVDSFEAYRQWLAQTAAMLGVEQLQLLDEPTAAALEYGLLESRNLLIVDFGGGTLDLALVQPAQAVGGRAWGTIVKWGGALLRQDKKPSRTAKVMAKAAQTLGGADIDRWLAEAWCQQQNLQNNRLIERLAERVKVALSVEEDATEVFFDDTSFRSAELTATRSQLNQLLQSNGLFSRLDTALQQVLLQATQRGVTQTDIDAVVAVGGTCNIPAIQDWLTTQFGRDKVFIRHPLEAIAHGALQLGVGVEVRDFLYHSYGIRYWNHKTNSHGWHPLVQAGLPYPLPDPVELVLGASSPDQPSVELVIGELGESDGSVEVFFVNGQLVTRQRLEAERNGSSPAVQALNDSPSQRTIAKLEPLGQPGSDRLRLEFQVDGQRRLCVTVEDLLTNRILLANRAIIELR